jgi:hypothetical protein
MKTKYFALCMFLALTHLGQAQDFKKAVNDMRGEFMDASQLQVVMKVLVFDSKTASDPDSEQVVEIRRSGESYAYSFDDREMLLTEKSMIIVDKSSRKINWSTRDISAERKFHENVTFNLDSILSTYTDVTFEGHHGDIDHYVVDEKKGAIARIHIYLNTETHGPRKIEYEYREGPFVSIDFLAFNTKPYFDALTFSEERIVQVVDKKALPSRYYKNFTVNRIH